MTVSELCHQLQTVYTGAPWYGISILEKLHQIPVDKIGIRPQNKGHNIAEILEHLIVWRDFVLKKLDGDADFDIEIGSLQDWPPVDSPSTTKFQELLQRLASTQEILLTKLQEKDDAWLKMPTLGKDYSNETMVVGLIQHDIYHLGQIGLLTRLLK